MYIPLHMKFYVTGFLINSTTFPNSQFWRQIRLHCFHFNSFDMAIHLHYSKIKKLQNTEICTVTCFPPTFDPHFSPAVLNLHCLTPGKHCLLCILPQLLNTYVSKYEYVLFLCFQTKVSILYTLFCILLFFRLIIYSEIFLYQYMVLLSVCQCHCLVSHCLSDYNLSNPQ